MGKIIATHTTAGSRPESASGAQCTRRAGSAPLKLRDDHHLTHPAALRALLAVEDLPRPPDQSGNRLPAAAANCQCAARAGLDVLASDLVDYGVRDQQARWDLLLKQRAPPGVAPILSNSPYKIAAEIVEHALTLCPSVIFLLTRCSWNVGGGAIFAAALHAYPRFL